MVFGEFLCLKDKIYKETIVNYCPSPEDADRANTRFWEEIEIGDIVHTTMPRVNTKAKNANYTEFRADLRQISEQPIDLQQRFIDIVNEPKEAMGIGAGRKVSLTGPVENNTEKTKQVTEATKLPKQLNIAKTNARIKYIEKMVGKSTYNLSDVRIYSKVLGDLIDTCIELNIDPYDHD